MKSSTAMLAAVFLLVAAALFIGVYMLMRDSSAPAIIDQAPPPVDVDENGRGNRADRGDRGGSTERNPTSTQNRRILVIEGRVMDADGMPVEGAVVRQLLPAEFEEAREDADWPEIRTVNLLFESIDEEEWDRPRPMESLSRLPTTLRTQREAGIEITNTLTDSDGVFRLEYQRGMGAGPFQIKASKDAVGSATATGVRGVQANQKHMIELRLGGKGVVKGHVLSGAEGHRIEGAYVILDDGDQQYTGTCDADGRFKIEDIGPGQYVATAGAAGHAPLTDELVQVIEGQPVELRLPRGVDLVIVATAETDDGPDLPVAAATVYALHDETYTYIKGITGADGRLVFEGLPPGTWFVNGLAKDLAPFADEMVTVKPQDGRKEVELYFEQTVVTPIVVKDTGGRPVEGVKFYSSTWDEEYDQARSVELPGATDAGGNWTFRFEFDGPHGVIYAVAPGYGMAYVTPDDEVSGELLEITLAPGVVVFGKVTDETGAAVPDAVVEMECIPDADEAEDVLLRVRTDAEGKYRFAYGPVGEISVSAWDQDDYSDDVTFEAKAGQKEKRVDLTFGDAE